MAFARPLIGTLDLYALIIGEQSEGGKEEGLEMFLFTFGSRVNSKSKEANRLNPVGGAYVNCWINFKDHEAAEKLAKLLIREQGWIPEIKTEESRIQKK